MKTSKNIKRRVVSKKVKSNRRVVKTKSNRKTRKLAGGALKWRKNAKGRRGKKLSRRNSKARRNRKQKAGYNSLSDISSELPRLYGDTNEVLAGVGEDSTRTVTGDSYGGICWNCKGAGVGGDAPPKDVIAGAEVGAADGVSLLSDLRTAIDDIETRIAKGQTLQVQEYGELRDAHTQIIASIRDAVTARRAAQAAIDTHVNTIDGDPNTTVPASLYAALETAREAERAAMNASLPTEA